MFLKFYTTAQEALVTQMLISFQGPSWIIISHVSLQSVVWAHYHSPHISCCNTELVVTPLYRVTQEPLTRQPCSVGFVFTCLMLFYSMVICVCFQLGGKTDIMAPKVAWEPKIGSHLSSFRESEAMLIRCESYSGWEGRRHSNALLRESSQTGRYEVIGSNRREKNTSPQSVYYSLFMIHS